MTWQKGMRVIWKSSSHEGVITDLMCWGKWGWAVGRATHVRVTWDDSQELTYSKLEANQFLRKKKRPE